MKILFLCIGFLGRWSICSSAIDDLNENSEDVCPYGDVSVFRTVPYSEDWWKDDSKDFCMDNRAFLGMSAARNIQDSSELIDPLSECLVGETKEYTKLEPIQWEIDALFSEDSMPELFHEVNLFPEKSSLNSIHPIKSAVEKPIKESVCLKKKEIEKPEISPKKICTARNAKRPAPKRKEDSPRKKRKEEEAENSKSFSISDIDSSNEVIEIDKRLLKRIELALNVLNSGNRKISHRKGFYFNFTITFPWKYIEKNGVIEKEDKNSQILINTHIEHCKHVFKKTPMPNETLVAIITRTRYIYTKLADFQDIAKNPSKYMSLRGLSGYYPKFFNHIIEFMANHGPIITSRKNIKAAWTENLGDIALRRIVDPSNLLEKGRVFINKNKYASLEAAVQMILSLHEVYNDLLNLSSRFITQTLGRNNRQDSAHYAVVMALKKIAQVYKQNSLFNLTKEYNNLYSALMDLSQGKYKNLPFEKKVFCMYSKLYKSLVYFYSKAKICEEVVSIKKKSRNYIRSCYVLNGKCIIKSQRYFRCITFIGQDEPMQNSTHEITEETNRWTIKPHIAKHYHIHYVDNTAQRYKRLCMPMYKGTGYVHTIKFIVGYIQRVFEIKEKGCVCPYKRDRITGKWSYVTDADMSRTIQDLPEHDVVFYYIEEGLLNNHFTFAQFDSYKKPEAETVLIPLFLTPLIRSLVGMGPFEEKDKEHSIIEDMQFADKTANVFVYKEKYKSTIYDSIHHYYSNLYIRIDNADIRTIDCYIMDAQTTESTVTWYVKVPCSVDEYTHCVLDGSFKSNIHAYREFINAVISQEYTPDSDLYGFGMHSIENTNDSQNNAFFSDESKNNQPINQKKYSRHGLKIVPIKNGFSFLKKEFKKAQTKLKDEEYKLGQIEDDFLAGKIQNQRKKSGYIKNRMFTLIKEISELKHQILKEEKESSVSSFPFCSFLLFQNSNNITNSMLGLYNELFNAMIDKYI